jgi:hypothetical protein
VKHLTIAACVFFTAGCIGPLWPKTHPDFTADYRGIDRVAVFRPEVGIVIEDPSGDTELSREIIDDTAEELSRMVETGLAGRGLRVTVLNPRIDDNEAVGDPAVEELRRDYLALSSKVMPQTRVLFASERLIAKHRRNPPVARRLDLGEGVGLGAQAVDVARRYEVDALFFVQLDVVFKTRAEYRTSTLWGAALPDSTVDYVERYLSPDHFALRLSLIDGQTGDILWAFNKARETGSRRPTVAKRLATMLDELPPAH